MSRVSDTRLRTRETAVRLVAAGRRHHELTVDLIYAEIKQGSRTTINDELKLWKDEQAKADALTTALPPAVATAMLNIWAVAVEHGEKVFDQRREEVETQLAQATTRIESLESEKNQLTQRIEGLQTDVTQGQSECNASREMLASERAINEAAVAHANDLEQRLEAAKVDSEQAITTLKSEHRQQIEALQAALAAQENAFLGKKYPKSWRGWKACRSMSCCRSPKHGRRRNGPKHSFPKPAKRTGRSPPMCNNSGDRSHH